MHDFMFRSVVLEHSADILQHTDQDYVTQEEYYSDESIDQIEHNLALAEAFFSRWPGLFTWRRPMAGSVALVGMNVPSVLAFSHKLAKEAGVLILPAAAMGGDDQHMRMGFGRAAFGAALERFEAYLAAHPNV